MVKEFTVPTALAKYPSIRNVIPKELIREISKDDNYIIRIEFNDFNQIGSVEIGYPEDEEWINKTE